MLREDAVAKFIATFLPKRYRPHTNVFASSSTGIQHELELDLVLLDEFEGVAWPVDADAVNSVVTWEHVTLVAEIKSKLRLQDLNKACDSMAKLESYAAAVKTEIPTRLLFAFDIDEDTRLKLLEDFAYKGSSAYPFDAIIILPLGAFVSEKFDLLRVGFENGLGPELASSDGPSQDKLTAEFAITTSLANGFMPVGDCSIVDTLISFATIATAAATSDKATQSLLSALKMVDHFPIWVDDELDVDENL